MFNSSILLDMISEDGGGGTGAEMLDIFAVIFQIFHNNRLLNALEYDIGRGKGWIYLP